MIIILDKSIFDAYKDRIDVHIIDELIEDICKQRRKGKHLIFANKKDILQLISDENLSRLQSATLQQVNKELTSFDKSLLNECMSVEFFHPNYLTGEPKTGRHVIDITLIDLEKDIIPLPNLVLENAKDDIIFSAIASYTLKKKSLSNFNLNYQVLHGGGNTMIEVCRDYLNVNPLTFAICDSDRRTPLCKSGETSKGVLRVFDAFKRHAQFHEMLVHEVENLIPVSFLKEIARKEQLPTLEFLDFSMEEYPESYFYYDLKNGFKYSQVWDEDSDISKYWKSIYEEYAKKNDLCYLALSNKQLPLDENDNVIFNKLSSLLPHAINNIPYSDSSKFKPEILEDAWLDIGEKLVSWFISPKPIRI